jgi:hypothetical protein
MNATAIQQRKSPVRWTDGDIDKVWEALPGVMEKNRRRGLTWQVEHAGQVALGPDHWRRITSFAAIPSVLLKRIADRYPELKRVYGQLEHVNQLPIDKETFINLVVETRLSQPFTDFVDIWNECITLVPELELPEVSHAKYIDPDLSRLIQNKAEEWLLPEPELPPEPPPVVPKLEDFKAIELLTAYHAALMREMQEAFMGKPVAVIDKEVPVTATISSEPSPASAAQLLSPSGRKSPAPSPVLPEDSDVDGGRQKIRISIVDHNVSRTPADFEREYADNPHFKFKFFFTAIGSKDLPTFKQGGFAIISESAMVSWKTLAVTTCGRPNVFTVNGSRESVRDAMQRVLNVLASQRKATTNGKH